MGRSTFLYKLIIQTGSKLHFFASETKNAKMTFLGGKHGIEKVQISLVGIYEIYKVRQIPATIFVQLPIRFYHDLLRGRLAIFSIDYKLTEFICMSYARHP